MKIKAWLIGILISVFCIEGVLQVLSLGLFLSKSIRNMGSSSTTTFNVLALGESTTADLDVIFEDVSWPRQLEALLNKTYPDCCEVANGAIGGVASGQLVKVLKKNLEQNPVDLVVVMAGINDDVVYTLTSEVDGFFKVTRLVRWGYRVVSEYYTQFLKTPRFLRQADFDQEAAKKRYRSQLSQMSFEEMEEFLEKQIKLAPQDIESFIEFNYSLFERVWDNEEFKGRNLSMVRKAAKRILEVEPNSVEGHIMLSQTSALAWANGIDCLEEALQGLEYYPIHIGEKNSFLSNASRCLNIKDNSKKTIEVIKGRLAEQGVAVAENIAFEVTRASYQKMYQLALNHGVPILFMQYPMLSGNISPFLLSNRPFPENGPDSLLTLARNQLKLPKVNLQFEGAEFTENKSNFKSALKKYSSKEIFTDSFGGVFGHTTKLGHKIIADHVFLKILDMKVITYPESEHK